MAEQHSGHLQPVPYRLRNVLDHQVFLLAVLRYYQATHKSEYTLHQCSQNQLIHLSSGLACPHEPMLIEIKHEHNWQLLRWTNSVHSGGLTLRRPLMAHLRCKGWLEYRWDLDLLDYAARACSEAHSNDTAITYDEILRRASYMVEWVKQELSPERWQDSFLPDLLCIRAHPGVVIGSENDPYYLKNSHTIDLDNDEPSDKKHTLSGYGLLKSKSWMFDWEAHSPGHPLPAPQAQATKHEKDGDDNKGEGLVSQ